MKSFVLAILVLMTLTLSTTAKSSNPIHSIEVDSTIVPYSRQQELFLKEKKLREAQAVEVATLNTINDSLRRSLHDAVAAREASDKAAKILSEVIKNSESLEKQCTEDLQDCGAKLEETETRAVRNEKKAKRRGVSTVVLVFVTVVETTLLALIL